VSGQGWWLWPLVLFCLTVSRFRVYNIIPEFGGIQAFLMKNYAAIDIIIRRSQNKKGLSPVL
jgi:hypothetical protein